MTTKDELNDITNAGKDLTDKHYLYYKMVDEVQDYAIMLLDKEGIIQNWNRGSEKITQYLEIEAVGMHFRMFYSLTDQNNRLAEILLNIASTDGRAVDEGWRLRKDKTRFWANSTATALHDENGIVIGFCLMTRDLTERKEAEDRSNTFSHEMQQANESLAKTEQQYHKMVAEVEDYAIILLNEHGDILNWNAGAEKIKGYKPKEIIGKNFRIFYLPADQDSKLPEMLMERAKRDGKAIHEGWRVKKNGSSFWGSIVITALHNEDGDIIGYSKVTRDLTERKMQEDQLRSIAAELQKSNEALQKSEERYSKMIAEVQDYAIILLDDKGNVRNWNIGAEKIKGYTAPEIIGKNFRIFYLPIDQSAGLPEQLISIAIKEGKALHEGWRVRKDGSTFWGSIVITALHAEDGSIIGFSKVTRDLTERKKAEDKIQQYLRELEIRNRDLEQFAFIASHDLQEPLRKVKTFAKVIENNLQNEELVARYFSKINSTVDRMGEQIAGILNFSRTVRNEEDFRQADLNDILSEILNDFELLIQEKNASILIQPLPKIKCIPLQVTQLFSNLLGNALKFSPPNPVIEISFALVKKQEIVNAPTHLLDGEFVQITFSDNGIGFEQQYAEQIFTIFQRLHAKNEYPGTGIGLAICKKIMENHDGFISAKSEPGKGAQFNVYFPLSAQEV